MKRGILHFFMAIPGLVVMLYCLPVWHFPLSSAKGFSIHNWVFAAFMLLAVLNIFAGVRAICRKNDEKWSKTDVILFIVCFVMFLLLILLFFWISYFFVMSLIGIEWFPAQG